MRADLCAGLYSLLILRSIYTPNFQAGQQDLPSKAYPIKRTLNTFTTGVPPLIWPWLYLRGENNMIATMVYSGFVLNSFKLGLTSWEICGGTRWDNGDACQTAPSNRQCTLLFFIPLVQAGFPFVFLLPSLMSAPKVLECEQTTKSVKVLCFTYQLWNNHVSPMSWSSISDSVFGYFLGLPGWRFGSTDRILFHNWCSEGPN